MSTATATESTAGPRLKQKYHAEVKGALKTDLGLANVMQVPKMEKIVINMGVGRATQQPSLLEGAVKDLTRISGQKPIVTKARTSVASFKLREGQSIGCKVTLRGDRMWEFFDRLVSVAIPRIRDFRGLPATSWDGRGNYTFGLAEQVVFPEIDYDKIDAPRGMDITIVTSAATNEQGKALLDAFGFPFKREVDVSAPEKNQTPRTCVPRQRRLWQASGEEEVTEGHRSGKEVIDQQSECQAEVQSAWLQPVPQVRSVAFGVPQVWVVPCVPSQHGPRRRDPRHDQGELVRSAS